MDSTGSGRHGIPRVDRANKAPLLAPLLYLQHTGGGRGRRPAPATKATSSHKPLQEKKHPGPPAETRCFCCRVGPGAPRTAAVAVAAPLPSLWAPPSAAAGCCWPAASVEQAAAGAAGWSVCPVGGVRCRASGCGARPAALAPESVAGLASAALGVAVAGWAGCSKGWNSRCHCWAAASAGLWPPLLRRPVPGPCVGARQPLLALPAASAAVGPARCPPDSSR